MTDINYKLSTKEGLIQFETKKIVGQLKAIIVKTNEKLELNITSEHGYHLLELADASEKIYHNLVARKTDEYGHGLQDGSLFYLNEKLSIYINGKQNSDIEIILRF